MNITETGITINPLPTLIVVGAISFGVITMMTIRKFRRRRHRKEFLAIQKAEESEQKEVKETEQKRMEIEKLFPHPWIVAYDKCCTANSFSGSRLWFEKWIENQPALPSLTLEAVEEFRERLASKEKQGEIWISAINFFAPYIDIGIVPIKRGKLQQGDWSWNSRDKISPKYCKQHLPPKWYDLVKLFKGVWKFSSFGSTHQRQGFLDRIEKIEEIEENVLNAAQIKLLAQVLAEGDSGGSDFYAAHLEEHNRKICEHVFPQG